MNIFTVLVIWLFIILYVIGKKIKLTNITITNRWHFNYLFISSKYILQWTFCLSRRVCWHVKLITLILINVQICRVWDEEFLNCTTTRATRIVHNSIHHKSMRQNERCMMFAVCMLARKLCCAEVEHSQKLYSHLSWRIHFIQFHPHKQTA